MIDSLRVKILNFVSDPVQGMNVPRFRKCDECGKPAEFGERWRSGVSMPDTPTRTLCDGCGPE